MNQQDENINILGIIPARMESSRFPGKPLKKILNFEMIGHVYERSKQCPVFTELVVATCNDEIAQFISSLGGISIDTKNTHTRCTERAEEALIKAEEKFQKKFHYITLIQGDEPMVTPSMISTSLLALLKNPKYEVNNLLGTLSSKDEAMDPNEIKVVTNIYGEAMYMSRSIIPNFIHNKDNSYKKQVCIMSFKREMLLRFNAWKPTPLEQRESIDMLRILEHGHSIQMIPTEELSLSVDTPTDLKNVEEKMKNDVLLSQYLPQHFREGLNL